MKGIFLARGGFGDGEEKGLALLQEEEKEEDRNGERGEEREKRGLHFSMILAWRGEVIMVCGFPQSTGGGK